MKRTIATMVLTGCTALFAWSALATPQESTCSASKAAKASSCSAASSGCSSSATTASLVKAETDCPMDKAVLSLKAAMKSMESCGEPCPARQHVQTALASLAELKSMHAAATPVVQLAAVDNPSTCSSSKSTCSSSKTAQLTAAADQSTCSSSKSKAAQLTAAASPSTCSASQSTCSSSK
ncbi:MAG: hypothetical protein ACYTGC_18385, partial [Planctomycetota bacterium]